MDAIITAYALHGAYSNGDFLGFVRIYRNAEPNLPMKNIFYAWEQAYGVHERSAKKKGFRLIYGNK